MSTRKPWATSRRVVPSDWSSRKAAVLTAHGRICHTCGHGGAEECDHVIGVTAWRRRQLDGDPHHPSNLAPIHGQACPTCRKRCHQVKTATEAYAGRATRKRPVEQHPGLIR